MATNPVIAYFHGEGPLWKAFWLYGVIPSNVLLAAILAMVAGGATGAVLTALLAALLIYTGWIVVAVWRCADNVEVARNGVIARWLTVAWALNTVLFVFFLQLDVAL